MAQLIQTKLNHQTPRNWLRKLTKLFHRVKPFILPFVLVVMAAALWGMRQKIAATLAGANWQLIAIATVIAIIYLPINASIWSVILHSLGVKVTRWEAAKTWMQCEALRWLPGSIWGYASRANEAKKFSGTKRVGGLSLTLELAITILAWAIIALVGLGASGFIIEFYQRVSPTYKNGIIIAVVPAVALVISIPFAFQFLPLRIHEKIAQKGQQLISNLRTPTKLIQALTEYTCINFFYSIGFYLCFLSLSHGETPGLLAAIGANGLAWIAGIFSIGVPGGIGVREGVTAMVFQPFNLLPQAAAAAFLWRGVQLSVELTYLVIIVATRLFNQRKGEWTINPKSPQVPS